MSKPIRILLAGEGGQGIQTIAKILIKAASASGKKVTHLPNFGVEQRGGVSLAFVQISDSDISFPKFREADIALIVAKRAVERVKMHVGKDTLVIFDNSIIPEKELTDYKVEKVAMPASQMAKEKLIPRVFNSILLGVVCEEVGGINDKHVKKAIINYFKDKIKKKPQLKHFNLAAYELGKKTMKEISVKK